MQVTEGTNECGNRDHHARRKVVLTSDDSLLTANCPLSVAPPPSTSQLRLAKLRSREHSTFHPATCLAYNDTAHPSLLRVACFSSSLLHIPSTAPSTYSIKQISRTRRSSSPESTASKVQENWCLDRTSSTKMPISSCEQAPNFSPRKKTS